LTARIQSIERAAAILRLLSGRSRRLGVAQLAGELELPKATVHGILRTLAGVGFVEQDAETGKYAAGLAVGFWPEVEELRAQWHKVAEWLLAMDPAAREKGYRKWRKAVARTVDWVDEDDD